MQSILSKKPNYTFRQLESDNLKFGHIFMNIQASEANLEALIVMKSFGYNISVPNYAMKYQRYKYLVGIETPNYEFILVQPFKKIVWIGLVASTVALSISIMILIGIRKHFNYFKTDQASEFKARSDYELIVFSDQSGSEKLVIAILIFLVNFMTK